MSSGNEGQDLTPGKNQEGRTGMESVEPKVELDEEIAENGAMAGVVKLKPAREIYKPPNLRTSRSGHQGHVKGHRHFNPHQLKYNHGRPGSSYTAGGLVPNGDGVTSSRHSPPNSGNQGHVAGNVVSGPTRAPLNVNAQEFRFRNPQRQNSQWQAQDFKKYWDAAEVFPLVQSKSSGSMFTQFQKLCREEETAGRAQVRKAADQSEEPNGGVNQSGEPNTPHPPPPALQQSKSNGNLRRPHVRFLDLENRATVTAAAVPVESQLASLKIEASSNGPWRPQWVKSKSMFSRNHFEPPPPPPRCWEAEPLPSAHPDWFAKKTNPHHPIQRSKSFGHASGTRNFVHGEQRGPAPPRLSAPCWEDFQMDRWPKGVLESVKVAMAGLERVPARHKIDMVTRIFGTILGDYDSSLTLSPDQRVANGLQNFILPAVHIFLYFIQRETDETVLESFLNNCLATYQSIFQCSSSIAAGVIGSNSKGNLSKSSPAIHISYSTTSKYIIFLKLLSSFYQKTRQIQSQRSLEEVRQRLLSLLCDSCLVVLRLSPLSYTTELVDTLFLVCCTLGRDIETFHPQKMKGILAGVRDVLVGVGGGGQARSSAPQGLSPAIHKTLMQLIELHAANWQLPASAVRYYYANPVGAGPVTSVSSHCHTIRSNLFHMCIPSGPNGWNFHAGTRNVTETPMTGRSAAVKRDAEVVGRDTSPTARDIEEIERSCRRLAVAARGMAETGRRVSEVRRDWKRFWGPFKPRKIFAIFHKK